MPRSASQYTYLQYIATFLTTVERMCCQEPPSYLTETRVVHHALQYAIGIAVAGRVRYATGVSYIRAVQLPWFSRFQSQSLWGLYICPSSTRGTFLCSLFRGSALRGRLSCFMIHELLCIFAAKTRAACAGYKYEDFPAIKSSLIVHAVQTKCPNLVQKKNSLGPGVIRGGQNHADVCR